MQGYLKPLTAVFAVLLLVANSAPAEEINGPRIVFEKPEHDHGIIMEGETIRHTFTVFNRGNRTLQIKKVRPD